MKKVAVVGGGVAGLSVAQLLKDRCRVCVYEQSSSVGGLIRCRRVNGSLFHTCGGHVFNTKNERVDKWFWSRFDKDREFLKVRRHSAVCLDNGMFVDYPIENHVYQLDADIQRRFSAELAEMVEVGPKEAKNFGAFLRQTFGKTLYDLYFKPYNEKIWRCDLDQIPLEWLAGKLPMPTPAEMLKFNQTREEETSFVHSVFYYPRSGGSQLIADRLADGVDLRVSTPVVSLDVRDSTCCKVNGIPYDEVFFCGNVKELPGLLTGIDLGGVAKEIGELASHGTTTAFCEIDETPYSWFYQPTARHWSHRVICTGNFSSANNASGKMTCTVEFTDYVEESSVRQQLVNMPYNPKYITQCYSRYSYPIQNPQTRELIRTLRTILAGRRIRLVGRFAEWEYYNMDAVIASAIEQAETIC